MAGIEVRGVSYLIEGMEGISRLWALRRNIFKQGVCLLLRLRSSYQGSREAQHRPKAGDVFIILFQ